MIVGMTSMLRLVEISVMPSSMPICAKKLDWSRDMGAQTMFSSFLLFTSRTN